LNKPEGQIDPRLKLFKFNLNTSIRFEEITGKGMDKVDLRKPSDLRAVVWAGLVDELKDEKFDLVEAGKLIDGAHYKASIDFVVAEMTAGTPKHAVQREKGQEKKEVT
jgi:hypothetical protein